VSKVILRLIFYNKDFVKVWNTSRIDHTWFYPLFMFITAYFEYFALFASILISLKNNVAPSKKALVIYGKEAFNPSNQQMTNIEAPTTIERL
jgi:hypothetical protein